MFFVVFLLFLPLIEIALFAAVGDEVGAFNTVLLCLASAALGFFLLQRQGMKTALSIQESLDGGRLPLEDMFRDMCFFLAGVLLILPGFFTDIVALLLLLPPVQHVLKQAIAGYFTGEPVRWRPQQRRGYEGGDIVDVEYTHVKSEEDTPPALDSPDKRP